MPKHKIDQKEDIYNGILEIIAKHGYCGTTVRMMADKALLTKGGLLFYGCRNALMRLSLLHGEQTNHKSYKLALLKIWLEYDNITDIDHLALKTTVTELVSRIPKDSNFYNIIKLIKGKL